MKKFNQFYLTYGSVINMMVFIGVLVALLPIIPYLNLQAILIGGLAAGLVSIWLILLIKIGSFIDRSFWTAFMVLVLAFLANVVGYSFLVEILGIVIYLLLFLISLRLLFKSDEK